MGKTRLALEAAREMVGHYEHGVWLVELAPLSDPDLIPERVAAALGVQEQPGRLMRESVALFLRPKTALLLLDNVEHLVQAGAEFVDFLVERCPTLQLLVTSREPLQIQGEQSLPLAPLAMPQAEQPPAVVGTADGVILFLERARAIRPDFSLTEENTAVIGEIVRRLDGIPLALELAAARLRMMTVEQINGRLDDRFRLLTGGSRNALPRQQTLRALIDWSWNLLEEKEQVLMRRLAVFAGGWQLETAEMVAGFDPLVPGDVFEGLEQLINKSLVTVQYGAEDAHYYFLETIHQYALDKMTIAGDDKELRERHTACFIALADKYANNKDPHQYPALSERLRLNGDNLRQVWRSIQAERPGLALRFSGTLFRFESNWISPREAISWLEGAIARARNLLATDSAEIEMVDLTRAVFALAWVRVTNGQLAAGLPLLDESIQLARQQMNEPITYPNEVAEHTAVMAQLTETMGQAQRDKIMAEGARLNLDEAVLLALEGDKTAVQRTAKTAKL